MAQKKKKSMFFEKMEKSKGKQWIEYASPSEITKYSTMLFRDMAFGSIDKNQYGYAFFSDQFMATIITAARSQYEQNSIILYALNTLWATQPQLYSNPQSTIVHRKYTNICEAYSVISYWLWYMTTISDPYKLSILDFITNQISRHRYDL